jgi:hypothetical protein
MTVHADLCRRNVGDRGRLDRRVTIPAIESEFTDVELVAVGDRLNRTVADVRIPRRKVVPDARNGDTRHEDAGDGTQER